MSLEIMASNLDETDADPPQADAHATPPDDTDALMAIDQMGLEPLSDESGEYRPAIDVVSITEYFTEGIEFIRKRQWDNAIEQFRSGLELDTLREHVQCAIAMTNLGFCHDKLEEYDKAIEAYKQAIEIDPQCDQAHAGLACVYMDL